MTGEEIRIAQGLTESHIGDSAATRRNRGVRQFSMSADNSSGTTTLGVSANDRVTRFNRMMSSSRPPPSTTSRQVNWSSIGWPILLAVTVVVTGIVLLVAGALSCQHTRKHSLFGTLRPSSPGRNDIEDTRPVHLA